MRGATRKVLMGFLVVFMTCLIALTSATTVTAQEGWGTLKTGDEMQWQSSNVGTVTMKVINVDGKTITLEINEGDIKYTKTIDSDESLTSTNMMAIFPWLISLENKGDFSFTTTTYDFEGTTYQAYYEKDEYSSGGFSEVWYDTNTGILLEDRYTDPEGMVIEDEKLISTTADLAESTGSYGTDTGSCLGTLLIVLVSVTTVISYSLSWKQKKI